MAITATSADFDIVTSAGSLGRNMPQRLGRALWFPMWIMAAMGFTVGIILAIVRASEIVDGGDADTIMALKHVVAGFMFIGFASVFAAISFAIARILGEFRAGGGELQAATGREVRTLKMPMTAMLFIITMAMAMMTIIVAVVLHFVFAADVENTVASLEDAEQRFVVLDGIRRIGIATYLVSFLLGLGTIIQVLRFQAIRIRELAGEATRS
ncbi:MAG: hypothetical protein V3S31_04350 [Dehalococcoidia bacterium]